MSRIRFGILACSSVAKRRVIPAILAASNASLERIGSRSLEKARRFAKEFHCAKFGTYEDVLRDPEVDAVYISTPPALHEQWIRRAAARGKHVYCEKPAFSSYRAALNTARFCKRNGVVLMEGYMFAHHPQHAVVRDLVRRGKIGVPRLFCGEYIYPRPGAGNIRLQRELGGGVFFDSAGYSVFAALEIFQDPPTSVFCTMHIDNPTRVDDAVGMFVGFAKGQMSQHVAAFGLQYRSRYSVTGTKGRIEVTRAYAVAPDRDTTLVLETDSGQETIVVPAADQFKLMIEDFSNALTRPAVAADFERKILRLHRVMDAGRRSYFRKRSVPVARQKA